MSGHGAPFRVLALDHTPHAGGAEVALVTAAAGAEAEGARFAIAAPEGGELERLAHAAGVAFHEVRLDRVRAIRPLGARRALDAVARLIAEQRPDVVLANGLRALKACLALERNGPPLAAFVHDVLEPGTASRGLRAFDFFRSRVRSFVTPAEAARRGLIEIGIEPERVRVVPPAVITSAPLSPAERTALRESLGLAAADLAIGFVGQLEPRKGLDVLLEALERRPLAEGVACLVVGDDPFAEHRRYRDAVLGRARRASAVRVLGWRHDAARLTGSLDLLVCPSRGDACPLVVLQAMASGVPVVASRVGGIPEQLGDDEAGWLVPPGDALALRDVLDRALADPDARRARGAAGFARHRERFSVDLARAALVAALRAAV